MLTPLLAVLLQTAPAAAAPPPVPERFSILVPVGDQSCVRKPGDDIVVCGDPLPSQTLPLPDEAISPGPTPSNKYVTGAGALAAEGTPCAATQRGCQVGFGPPLMPIVKGAVDLAKRAFAKKPDKTGRVAIPLDDTP